MSLADRSFDSDGNCVCVCVRACTAAFQVQRKETKNVTAIRPYPSLRYQNKIPSPAAGDKGALPTNTCSESKRTVPNAFRVLLDKTMSQHKPANSPNFSGNLFCKRAL